jgi:cytochrome c553
MKKITVLSFVAAAVLFTACGEDAKKAAAEATAKATEVVKETTSNAVEATKDAAAKATEAAKAKATEVAAAAKAEAEKVASVAAEKAAEVKAATEAKAADAAQALKDRASAATEAAKETATNAVEATKEAVAPAADNAAGVAAYAKCAGCHGKDGKTKALGKSEVIAGQAAADLVTKLEEYKAGTRNVAGMGMLMKGQVASMSDDDIKAVSDFISAM